MLTHKQQYIYSKQEVSRGQNEGNLEGRRCRCRSVSDETSETTNMLLPTFHAQFSRETTKPKTQPGWLLAGTYGTPSCLQGFKKTVFSLSFIFFHCILVYLERMGQFFKCLITLWWYSLLLKYSPQTWSLLQKNNRYILLSYELKKIL